MTIPPEARFRPQGRNWPLIYAFLIECGGSTKTTSATSMATTAALRGYPGVIFDLDANMSTSTVMGWSEEDLKGRPTALDLITGKKTLDQVAVQARVRLRDGDDKDAFSLIPNLRLVPSTVELSGADTAIAKDPDCNDWFAEVLRSYSGSDEIFWVDFPATYGKMVYSVIRMMDENDSIIPSIRADPKDLKAMPKLIQELSRVRDKNRGRRSVPGRPVINHMLLTGAPTPSYTEAPARRAAALAEAQYGSVLAPPVRYSAEAKKLYEDACPLPILLPNSYPAVDYRKIMTHLGFLDRDLSDPE